MVYNLFYCYFFNICLFEVQAWIDIFFVKKTIEEGYFEYGNFEFENGNFEKQSGEL